MSPEGMWQLAIRLRKKRLIWLAKRIKNLCSILFHNSLAIGAEVGEDLYLGHHGLGVVVHDNVVLGKGVKIWQGVTLAVRAPAGSKPKIIVGDDVIIGANAVVVTPLGQGLSIGSRARIGAGAVVVRDVPAGATVVGNPARVVRQRPAPD
jgi:serine O-acetyltransferase